MIRHASLGAARQRGQAAFFVAVTLVLALGAFTFLYKAGVVTSEKMQLQNAADAAAYSVSVIEARDLNFMAYTNRAMVANEVAIAQLVGIHSMLVMYGSVPEFINIYLSPLKPASLGILVGPIEAIVNALNSAMEVVVNTSRAFLSAIVPIMGAISQVYSFAQLGFHAISTVLALVNIDAMIKANSPDAKLSDLGLFSLVGHVITYGLPDPAGATAPSAIDRLSKFIKSYRQRTTNAQYQTGMERFAATTAASRDPFTESRSWDFRLRMFPPIGEELRISIEDPLFGGTILEFWLEIRLTLARRGGSELRYKTAGSRRGYSWSGADTVQLQPQLRIGFRTFLGFSLDIETPPEIAAPFAAGSAQAGRTGQGALNFVDMTLPKVHSWSYGRAPEFPVTWSWTGYPLGIAGEIGTQNIGRSYRGLPRYHDTLPVDDERFGFQAPYLVVGLVKEIDDIFDAGSPNPAGRLRLDNAPRDDEVAAIAKSEVYFSRPTDLSYFARADGRAEYGSTFNPYWQARLVDTTFADRVISLLVQQKEPWIPGMPEIAEVAERLDDLIPF